MLEFQEEGENGKGAIVGNSPFFNVLFDDTNPSLSELLDALEQSYGIFDTSPITPITERGILPC